MKANRVAGKIALLLAHQTDTQLQRGRLHPGAGQAALDQPGMKS
jgi:hypothetical protein